MFLDYFDKVFLVNLKKRKDRLQRFISRISSIGESVGAKDSTITLFDAVEGAQIPTSERRGSPGVAGCRQSHINIIKKAKKNNYDKILILEDDVTFSSDFSIKFNELMRTLPEDWDMLYFGGNHQESPIKIKGICHKVKVYSTHAYAVKSTLYDHIITILEKHDCPVDVAYRHEIHELDKFKTYGAYPQIAGQEVGHSDILNRKVDHRRVLGDVK